jgi:chaperonin GroES
MATVPDLALIELDNGIDDALIADNDAIADPAPLDKITMLAASEGDLSHIFSAETLARIGQDVCEDYKRDKADRREWEEIVEAAFKSAAQEQREGEKSYPWDRASDVRYPLLTVAATQFAARAYPAIVKGDEAVSVKVVGNDNGVPQMGPQGPVAQPGPDGQPQPVWNKQPGMKAARAGRVRDYLNTVLFYRMTGWEQDTDQLLQDLPIAGCAFRKVWFDARTGMQRAALVPALNLVAPMGAKDCETAPRLTEVLPDVFPNDILVRQRSGFYRDVLLSPEDEDDQAPRTLLEQHRLIDLDDDGLPEPYIVTVDQSREEVLRIEAAFGADDLKMAPDGATVAEIKRRSFFVKYDFFPHPGGKFYGIGLGHLLSPIGDVINTSINQMVDAATAQVAGGGFIASGLRLQRSGGSRLRFAPGEYKTVDGASGIDIRQGIVERTFPSPSPITFQILEMMLGAAKDISSVKDVITGDASNQGQVGTTLALIEQGLQVFTAIYKRIYRALKEEFTLLYDNLSRYGGDRAAADYTAVLDDPAADFDRDFNQRDFDIRPVSDPTSVTRMQKAGRAQAIMQVNAGLPPGTLDAREVAKRTLEALDVEEIEKFFPAPQGPNPAMIAEMQAKQSQAALNVAKARHADAQAGHVAALTDNTVVATHDLAVDTGMKLGGAL